MSIQAMAWVLAWSCSEGSTRLVLMAIANHADADGFNAFPKVEMIAAEARVDRATVFRCLNSLEALGEISRVRGHGRGRPNTYHLNLEKGRNGSQPATSEEEKGRISQQKGSHPATKGVASARRLIGTVLEPSLNRTPRFEKSETPNGQVKPSAVFPERCVSCGLLAFDCVCDRGPLIQGLGRQGDEIDGLGRPDPAALVAMVKAMETDPPRRA